MALPDKDALLEAVRAHRAKWSGSTRPDRIEPVGPGEESVWDYPRPPEVRATVGEISVLSGDGVVARTTRGLNVIETAGAPVHYVPPGDVRTDWLEPTDHITICEWKGAAIHFDLITPAGRITHAAFSYPDPLDDLGRGFSRIAGYLGFYPAKLACLVGAERVAPQPGGLYAGWVTERIKGPIKGGPGTGGW